MNCAAANVDLVNGVARPQIFAFDTENAVINVTGTASMASELEFTVFEGDWRSLRAQGYRGLAPDGFYSEDYQVFQGTAKERLMRAIRTGMEAAGIPIEASKGEGVPNRRLLRCPPLRGPPAARGCDSLRRAILRGRDPCTAARKRVHAQ